MHDTFYWIQNSVTIQKQDKLGKKNTKAYNFLLKKIFNNLRISQELHLK